MSFLSDIGKSIGGGLGSAVAGPIGGIVGSSLGDTAQDWLAENGQDLFSGLGRSLGSDLATGYETRRALGKDRQWDAGRFARLKRDAEAGGFNAYAALNATGNTMSPTAGTRVGTLAAKNNQFDQIDAILTGQAAEDRARQKVRDELERIELDERRTGQIKTSENTSNRQPRVGGGVAGFNLDRTGRVVSNDPNSGDNFELRGLTFPGVHDENAVNGTVPYVGLTGQAVPGPNAANQMGIDEVLGWVAMEAYAGTAHAVNVTADSLYQTYLNKKAAISDGQGGVDWFPDQIDNLPETFEEFKNHPKVKDMIRNLTQAKKPKSTALEPKLGHSLFNR